MLINKVFSLYAKTNQNPQRAISILDKKELTAGIMKSSVIIEHESGIVIRASGSLTVLLSV